MPRALFPLLILAAAVPAAAQFVGPGGTIPAVANTPGEDDTFWRSDVSIRNVSSSATEVTLLLLPEIRNAGPTFEPMVSDPIPVPGDGHITLQNVVTSVFGLRNKKGGLSVFANDGAPLVLASRTYTNAPGGGSYGLNVHGVLVGDTGWIAGVREDAFYRTNIGIFVPADPPTGQPLIFTVTTTDDEGLEVAQGSLTFEQAGMQQKGLDFFGVDEALLDGSVSIRCSDPTAIWYGYATVIDNASQDSVYRPAVGQQSALP